MQALLGTEVLGNDLARWALALVVGVVVAGGLALAKRVVVARLQRAIEATATRIDDAFTRALDRTHPLTLIAAGVAAGARSLDLSHEADEWLGRGLVVVLAVQLALWITGAVKLLFTPPSGEPESPGRRTMSSAAIFVTNLVVWSVIVLVVLSNLGVEVSTLAAGLGVGGIAAALAVQNVLGDLFAAFSIYVDRPFDIGDFVVVDTYMGTVERIGWRSARLRSLGGEMIVLANSDLARARIRNYRRMSERRVVLSLGVEYGTPAEKLQAIPSLVRGAIEATEGLRFDRSHLSGFGQSSIDIETVFYVLSPEYGDFMDRQQRVLLAIHRAFEREEIRFAFPTRTVHVVGSAVSSVPTRESQLGSAQ